MLKNTGERIGTCGFHCHNRETSEIELGYNLYPTYRRQGYAAEAPERILRFAKEEMSVQKVYAHISVDNVPSIKAALRQGFKNTDETYYEDFHGSQYLHAVYSLEL